MSSEFSPDVMERLLRAIKALCEDAALPDDRLRFYILEAINENLQLEDGDE